MLGAEIHQIQSLSLGQVTETGISSDGHNHTAVDAQPLAKTAAYFTQAHEEAHFLSTSLLMREIRAQLVTQKINQGYPAEL